MRRCRPNERGEEVSSPNPTCETWNGNPLRRFSRAGRYRPDVDKVKMRESEAGPPAYSRCDCPDLSIARSQPRPRPSVSERRLPLVSFSASRWPCSVETRGREREGGREGRPDERTFSKLSAAIARSSASVHSPLSPSHSLPPSLPPSLDFALREATARARRRPVDDRERPSDRRLRSEGTSSEFVRSARAPRS